MNLFITGLAANMTKKSISYCEYFQLGLNVISQTELKIIFAGTKVYLDNGTIFILQYYKYKPGLNLNVNFRAEFYLI